MRRSTWLTLAVALSLGACKTDAKLAFMSAEATGSTDAVAEFGPSADSLAQGQLHFRNKDYGLAERHFRAAVEKDANNSDAWLGLAASYDHLRRFELAERAYGIVVKQVGYTFGVHNNLGYHYYLRGDLAKAQKHFDAAYKLEPDNPHVRNNLLLVASASRL